jgi:tetratricopeptide (TPR) repeat protein
VFKADGPLDVAVRYAEACGLAAQGQYVEARRIYAELEAALAGAESEARVRALVRSDLAAIAAIEGRFDEALAGWRAALEIDPECLVARLNRDLIEAELTFRQMNGEVGELKLAPAPAPSPLVGDRVGPFSAEPRKAGVNGNAPPHPPFGHPLPERGEGEFGRTGGGVGLGSADLCLASAVGNADPHLPFGHPLPRGEGEGTSCLPSFIGPPPWPPLHKGGKVPGRCGWRF